MGKNNRSHSRDYYTPDEDEAILMIMANRGALSQRKALAMNLHLLPGRSLDGALQRYKTLNQQRDLEAARKRANERKAVVEPKKPYGGQPGVSMEPWKNEEEALLWNLVQTRPAGQSAQAALKEVVKYLPGRTLSSITNRYYVLKDKLGGDVAIVPPEAPTEPQEPAQETIEPVELEAAAVIVEQPKPRLAERAEEFIESLFSVVQENKELRQKAEQLEAHRAATANIEAELQAERAKVTRLRAQITELEEDRDSFLRLMDKARAIGREEVGIK